MVACPAAELCRAGGKALQPATLGEGRHERYDESSKASQSSDSRNALEQCVGRAEQRLSVKHAVEEAGEDDDAKCSDVGRVAVAGTSRPWSSRPLLRLLLLNLLLLLPLLLLQSLLGGPRKGGRAAGAAEQAVVGGETAEQDCRHRLGPQMAPTHVVMAAEEEATG